MNKKQLIFILIAAVVVVAAGIIALNQKQESWNTGDNLDRNVLPGFPVNDIAKVVIAEDQGEVVLQKKNDKWRVVQRYDYPAKFETLRDFLRNLHELKAAQIPAVGESQYGRLKLLAPGKGDESGIQVTFFDNKGTELATVILGKEHQKKSSGAMGGSWPDGRYLRVPERNSVVLVSETFSSIKTEPTDWLQTEFFKLGDIKTAQLLRDNQTVWTLSRETKTGDLQMDNLPEGRELDSSKVQEVKNAFSWASFEDVADPELSPEETGLATPTVFKARDFDGFVYTVNIGNETDSNYYVAVQVQYDGPQEREAEADEKSEDKEKKDKEFQDKLQENRQKADELNERLRDWVYVVKESSVDDVLKDVEDLLKEKKEEEQKENDQTATTDEQTTPAAEPAAE